MGDPKKAGENERFVIILGSLHMVSCVIICVMGEKIKFLIKNGGVLVEQVRLLLRDGDDVSRFIGN